MCKGEDWVKILCMASNNFYFFILLPSIETKNIVTFIYFLNKNYKYLGHECMFNNVGMSDLKLPFPMLNQNA